MTKLQSGENWRSPSWLYKRSPRDQQNQKVVLYFPLPAELAQLRGTPRKKNQATQSKTGLAGQLWVVLPQQHKCTKKRILLEDGGGRSPFWWWWEVLSCFPWPSAWVTGCTLSTCPCSSELLNDILNKTKTEGSPAAERFWDKLLVQSTVPKR